MSNAKRNINGAFSGEYLSGCGIEYVTWLPVEEARKKVHLEGPIEAMKKYVDSSPKESNLRQRIKGRRIRAFNKLMHKNIKTWEHLGSLTEEDFSAWRNYGRLAHDELRKFAANHGIELPGIAK